MGPDLFDGEAGTADPAIFTDPDIYGLEQERIFTREWLFVVHESEVGSVYAKPGVGEISERLFYQRWKAQLMGG